jgi:hypothetical protein
MNIKKRHTIATNFNGKLGTQAFIHITLAPAKMVTETFLQGTLYEIITQDGSHPPVVVQLDDLARFPFAKCPHLAKCLTWCSHAMDPWEMMQWLTEKNPDINGDTELAIMFFKKVAA